MARYLVVGEESKAAYAVAVEPDKYIDIKKETLVFDKGVTPSETVYLRDPQKYSFLKAIVKGGIDFQVEPENIGWFLKWALGNHSKAGASPAAVTHTFKAKDMAAAESVYSFTDIVAAVGEFPTDTFRKHSGMMIDSLSLESALDVLTGSISCVGKDETKDSSFTPTDPLTISSLRPFVFTQATMNMPSGTDISAYLRAFRLTVNNNIPVDDLYGHGSEYLQRRPAVGGGARTIEVSVEMAFKDLTEYDVFLAGTEIDDTTLVFTGITIAGATPAANYTLTISLPRMLYKSDVAPHIDRREPLRVTVPLQVLYDTTDKYALKIDLKNAVADYADVA